LSPPTRPTNTANYTQLTSSLQAVDLVQELGRRATIITGDYRETTYLFQQLSVALQQGNAVSFKNTFTTG